jgi:arylsulfatase A-like enzyme
VRALAKDGLSFRRAYSTAGATPQSFAGILLSNFFQNYGISRGVPDHLDTLAEALRRGGFHTVGLNAANVLISHFYGYDRGFEEFCDFFEGTETEATDGTFVARVKHSGHRVSPTETEAVRRQLEARPQLLKVLLEVTGKRPADLVRHIAGLKRFNYSAADLMRWTLEALRRNRGRARQFYWLHLMDVHEPIHVPFSPVGHFSPVEQVLLDACATSPFGVMALRGQADKYRQLYDSAVSYVDFNVGILVNFLADAGLLERSLVCVTGDHGQELLEEGRFGHGYDRLTEPVIHVPLLFGGGLARRISPALAERPVSSLDIAPTILDVCSLPPPASFLGRSLNDTEPRPVYGQTFYEGVRNRAPDKTTRRLFLKPYPRPVKYYCKEMFYHIQGDYQLIHDVASGRGELHPLGGRHGASPTGEKPDPERMRRQARAYFESVYEVPDQQTSARFGGGERELVEARLKQLGYL